MNLVVLRAELITGHPTTGAYSLNNQIAADEINAVNRTLNRESMTSSEVYNAIDSSEYVALDAGQKEEVWNILHLGEINPFGFEAVRFTVIFGGGSVTIASLATLRKTSVSRAGELG